MGLYKRLRRKIHGITSEELLDDLRADGAEIGKKVIVFDPRKTTIDSTRPWLLRIGSYTKITSGVVILTLDYSLSVMRRVYGDWVGEGAITEIGENCFIGMNSVILMGSRIGDNVIVGAGSVVHGSFPGNVVIAGNPAKVISTLDEHYARRKRKTIDECKACVRQFVKTKGRLPEPKDLSGFKFLYAPRDEETIEAWGLSFACNGDEPAEVEHSFYDSEPYWASFEAMLEEAMCEGDCDGSAHSSSGIGEKR